MSNKAVIMKFEGFDGNFEQFTTAGTMKLPLLAEKQTAPNINDVLAYNMAFGIMKPDGKSYNKAAIETLINLLQDFMQVTSKNITVETIGKEPSDRMTEDGIPLGMLYSLLNTVNGLQYMINCTSWRTATPTEGCYEGFDKFELETRISFK